MFEPNFQRTDLMIDMIARIEVARDRILRAPIVPRWETELRREALVRSAHHSTSIEGNPLSLQEVTDLLAGRDVDLIPSASLRWTNTTIRTAPVTTRRSALLIPGRVT